MKMCYYCMKPKTGDVCETCRKMDPIISSEKLLPETILNNKYVVGNPVGSGGFGITYVGLDVSLQLKVAVKEFFPKEFVERNNSISASVNCIQTGIREKDIANEIIFKTEKDKVINEARTLAKFSKESSIVSVRDYFEANNTAYIVMEYIEGDTLEYYILHNGTISADKAFDMLLPIMNVLAKLHNQNIIHRDVSPDNIMFDGSNLKLLDFGAAREVLNNSSKSVSVMVKHGFAPEEQYRKKGRIGAWTDIYSLCATIYFCITGQIPENALDRKEADELKYPSSLGAVINKQQERALMYGLNVSSKDRCESIEELINVWNGAEIQKNTTDMETERYQETVDIYSFSKNTVDARRINRDTIISSQAETVSPMQQVITRPDNNQKKRIPIFLVAIVCALIIAAAAGIIILTNNNSKSHESSNSSDYVPSDMNNSDIDNSQVSVNSLEESVNSTDDEYSDEQVVSTESSSVSSDSSESHEKESSIIEETSVLSEEEIRNGKIQEYIEKANTLAAEGNYLDALALLDSAEQIMGADQRISKTRTEIKKGKLLSDVSAYEAAGDYKTAIEYISNCEDDLKTDLEVIHKSNSLKTTYKSNELSRAQTAYNNDNFDEALSILNAALTILPGDADITARIEKYTPVLYRKLPNNILSGSIRREDIVIDSKGNSYNDQLVFYAEFNHYNDGSKSFDKPNIEQYTGGKYSRFKAIIIPHEEMDEYNNGCGAVVTIYADDRLIYTSPTITRKGTSVNVDLDISGVQYLKIQVKPTSSLESYENKYTIILADAKVYG